MTITTAYSQILDTDSNGWNGYTIVMEVAVAGLTIPAGAISGIRVTFEAGAGEQLIITNAYVGHKAASGDAYDFLATPVQLTWAAAGNKTITAGASAATDIAPFVYNKTSNLLIAYYPNGGTGGDTIRYKSGLSNIVRHYKAATNEAGTVDKSAGYTSNADINFSINKIEFETVDFIPHVSMF